MLIEPTIHEDIVSNPNWKWVTFTNNFFPNSRIKLYNRDIPSLAWQALGIHKIPKSSSKILFNH